MLIPKKLKHRKQHKGRIAKKAQRGYDLTFGRFGLKAEESGWLTARQIEAARRVVTRYIKKGGQLWIRVFPDKPRTAKPAETGMGGGKGSLDHFVAVVPAGWIILELDGVGSRVAKEALKLAAFKIPLQTRVVERE